MIVELPGYMEGEQRSAMINGVRFILGMLVEVIKDYYIEESLLRNRELIFREGEIREVEGLYDHGMDRNGMIKRIAINNYPAHSIPRGVAHEFIKKFKGKEEIVKFEIGDKVTIFSPNPTNESGVHYGTRPGVYEIIGSKPGFESEFEDWELQDESGYYQYISQKVDYRFMKKVGNEEINNG